MVSTKFINPAYSIYYARCRQAGAVTVGITVIACGKVRFTGADIDIGLLRSNVCQVVIFNIGAFYDL